ncbi:MAG: glycosyltransferase family 4 protein [Candidatus Hodarchaeota archaeon]
MMKGVYDSGDKFLRICMVNEVANQAFHLTKGLVRNGHQVKVILHESKRSDTLLFSQQTIPNVEVCWLKGGPRKFRAITMASPLIQEIVNFKPDLIHTHYLRTLVLLSTIAAIALRVPVIGVAHGSDIRGFRQQLLRRAVLRIFMHRINRIILTAKHFKKEAFMVPQEKMVYIPRIIDTDLFQPGEASPELRNKYGEKVILSVASLTKIKTPEKMVRAFRFVVDEIPDAQLLFCGDGPEKSTLLQLRDDLGLTNNVAFLGNVPNSQMPKYYNFARAEAHAFNRRTPALGISHLEARACGLPVVTYVGRKKIPGVISVYNENDIAEALIHLLQDTKYSEQLGQLGLAHVLAHSSIEAVTQQTLQLYNQVLGKRK